MDVVCTGWDPAASAEPAMLGDARRGPLVTTVHSAVQPNTQAHGTGHSSQTQAHPALHRHTCSNCHAPTDHAQLPTRRSKALVQGPPGGSPPSLPPSVPCCPVEAVTPTRPRPKPSPGQSMIRQLAPPSPHGRWHGTQPCALPTVSGYCCDRGDHRHQRTCLGRVTLYLGQRSFSSWPYRPNSAFH